ncbi:MAG: twin-arginine translocase TatA/TatE family subunit, partial [Planctomycetota bacterium]
MGAGPTSILILLGIALLLFGNRLPSVARSLGQSIVEF